MNELLYALLPKLRGPKRLFFGLKSKSYICSLPKDTSLVLVSSGFAATQGQVVEDWFGEFKQRQSLSGEPTAESLEKLRKISTSLQFTTVIGVGGGAVLDTAKIISSEFDRELILVPTTLGSGAEATPYAVYLVDGRKKVLIDERFIPDSVCLVPEFLKSVSQKSLYLEIADSLAHGLEGLVSRLAHPLSDQLAKLSLGQICQIISSHTQKERFTIEELTVLQFATHQAGVVQGSVGTGLMHALAHVLGPRFGLSHAQAIAAVFLPIVRYNLKTITGYKKLEEVQILPKKLDKYFSQIWQKFDLEVRLKISKKEIREIAELVKKDQALVTHPVNISTDEIGEILLSL